VATTRKSKAGKKSAAKKRKKKNNATKVVARTTAVKRAVPRKATTKPKKAPVTKAVKKAPAKTLAPTSAAPATPSALTPEVNRRSRAPAAGPTLESVAAEAEVDVRLTPTRRHVRDTLVALNRETGNNGGGEAAADVIAFVGDPGEASPELFFRVNALRVKRWFVGQGKPNQVEQDALWTSVRRQMKKGDTANPGGWNGESTVLELGNIADIT